MAKISIKSEKVTPFGGLFYMRGHFSRYVRFPLGCPSFIYIRCREDTRGQRPSVSFNLMSQFATSRFHSIDYQIVLRSKFSTASTDWPQFVTGSGLSIDFFFAIFLVIASSQPYKPYVLRAS